MKDKVFISAKSEDYALAAEVFEFLKRHEVDAFFSDVSIPALGNSDYRKEIDKALDAAQHLIVVTSSGENVQSGWVEAEWGFFINEKRAGRKDGNLITLISDNLTPSDLPPSLRYHEVLSLNQTSLQKILHYVKKDEISPEGFHEANRPLTPAPKNLKRGILIASVLTVVICLIWLASQSKPSAQKIIHPVEVTNESAETTMIATNVESQDRSALKEVLSTYYWQWKDPPHPGGKVRFYDNGTFSDRWHWNYWITGPRTMRVQFWNKKFDLQEKSAVNVTFNGEFNAFSGEFGDGKLHYIQGTRLEAIPK